MSARGGSAFGGKKIQYLDMLKQSFSITWENKFLWLLGFLIFLGSVGTNLNVNNNSAIEQGKKIQDIAALMQNNPKLTIALGLVLIVVMLALFLLRILAVAGTIKAINDINLYRQLSVIAILKEAKKYLGRLILLEVIVFVALILVMVVLAIPVLYLFALKAKLLAVFISIIAIAIIVPLAILAYYLHRYAAMYIILGDEKIKMSLESAYILFAKNVKESLIMALVVVATGLLMIMAIVISAILLAIVFVPLGFVLYLILAKTGIMITAVIAILICATASVIVFSWYEAFLQTFWLLFFKQIASEKNNEKMILEKLEVEGKIPSPEVV
ncbi:MAG: hypothetical protein US70_C0014G0008 [Parcubacteria group bacterium GW2011_GWD2_38_11]|nr:MAG: hypothetical protein US70_C0014G0008 [Parcubacteria group bacterium GW2011_GWD2_38_11]